MNSINKSLLLALYSCFFLASSEAYAINGLVEDIELRSQYNFDQDEYSNALRFKINSVHSGLENKLIDLYKREEKAEMLFLKAQNKLIENQNNAKIKIAKFWSRDLKRAYSAYKEYLKSHPSSQRTSIYINTNEILIKAEDNLTAFNEINDKRVLIDPIDKESSLRILRSLETKKVSFMKKSSKRSLIKFFEISSRGNYNNSRDNEHAARLAFNLPVGSGKARANKKAALSEYKIKSEQIKKEQSLEFIYRELYSKRKLYLRLKSNLTTKKNIKRITASTSLNADDRLKIYLDTIKASYKVLDLKLELTELHNKISALTLQTDEAKFIGLGI